MGSIDPLANDVDNHAAGGISQPGRLLEMFLSDTLIEGLQRRPNEYRSIYRYLVVDQLSRNVAS